ncbi:transmembrane protein 161B-like isoform X2 [Corticium candelabrum]|uniref:transmembrane protein 161B-like isoform X2 n=1 Tax=Corticium candelabrum TaxID=121492 RepID=UPI002E257196|nr:transmembrane protein 161B-like isoform X2 [Corticium candelabrum]
MAVMGIQLVITLIVATLLHKVIPYISPAQFSIRGLKRYKEPSTDLLWRYRVGQVVSSKKGKDKRKVQDPAGVILNDVMFSVPRDNDIELETEKIQCSDLYNIHFCDNYEWIVNFGLSSLAVYVLTQIYFMCWPEMESQEMNLSIIWLLVAFFNSMYIFYLFNMALFRGSGGAHGEQSLMILCGCCFFVIAMAVMLLDDGILELGIDKAFDNITAKATVFKQKTSITTGEWQGALTVWKLILGALCGLVASFLTFPSFRMARLHLDSLKQTSSKLISILCNINFFAPLFLSIMWVKPLARDSFVSETSSDSKLTDELFDVFRLGAIFCFCLFRIALLRLHLQTHLALAEERFIQSKREPGRIMAVELQTMIQRVSLYLVGVALQYLVPVIVLMSLALLAHSFGSYSFSQGHHLLLLHNSTASVSRYKWGVNAEDEAVQQLGFVISQLAEVIDTPVFWEKHVMFGCWWMVTVWFGLSSLGIMYYRCAAV